MTQMPRDPDGTAADHATPPASAPGASPGTPTGSATAPAKDPLRASMTGRAWTAVVASGVVLLLLIIFIAQNTHSVTVAFLGWKGSTPLAVALLIAAVAGLFIAAVAGTLRIWQLRRRVRRQAR